MVSDQQVRRLFKLIKTGNHFGIVAAKSGMDEKTARKYRRLCKLPSDLKKNHDWRTRKDPFGNRWTEILSKLESNPGLEAKTIFEDLKRNFPGIYSDGQLRTLQRRVKLWRAMSGPSKEVYFPQLHYPGQLSQSDFAHMTHLGITIGAMPFDHLIYHFVLTYSNWEDVTVCFSESFESLSEGLQNALWKLGGVPEQHRTDQLSTAVQKMDHPDEFTRRYKDLLDHYGMKGCKTNTDSPHENGDVEQRHHRFKRALEQALLLRGSKDFIDRKEYDLFLAKLCNQLNAGRKMRFIEDQMSLKNLPERRIDSCKRVLVRVGPSSTIRVNHNVYSVDSRLIREQIEVRLYLEHIEIWYGQQKIDVLPRLRGEGKHAINYRHIIDSLVRKPGAFENFRYRDDLFPTSRFRIAYDILKKDHALIVATKQYLEILYLAARENETAVDDALRVLIEADMEVSPQSVKVLMASDKQIPAIKEVHIDSVDLNCYDELLQEVCP
jgi:hypothetical protein